VFKEFFDTRCSRRSCGEHTQWRRRC